MHINIQVHVKLTIQNYVKIRKISMEYEEYLFKHYFRSQFSYKLQFNGGRMYKT